MEAYPLDKLSVLIPMISLTAFLISSGLSIFSFRSSEKNKFLTWLSYGLFLIGTLSVTLSGVLTLKTSHLFAASVAWGSIVSWFMGRLQFIGAFTAPVVSLTLLLSVFFSDQKQLLNIDSSNLDTRFHVATAVLGQAVTVLTCGMSLLLLWLDRKLKSREIGEVPPSFPALATLGKSIWHSLWLGFTFVTLSLLSGALYVLNGSLVLTPALFPKILWAIFIWIWYLMLLVLHHILNYRPQKIARLSLLGFILVGASWIALWFVAPWSPT